MSDPQTDSQHELEAQLGKLWHHVIGILLNNELEYVKRGVKRTRKQVLENAIVSLETIFDAVRHSMRLKISGASSEEAKKELQAVLMLGAMPTSLALAWTELKEVHEGRRSRLFSKSSSDTGQPADAFLRRQAQALAAAAVEVLVKNGLFENEAAERVAATLNAHEFRNPRRPHYYAAGTVIDWRRSQTELFADAFERFCKDLHAIADGLPGQEEKHKFILFRLASFLQAFAYR